MCMLQTLLYNALQGASGFGHHEVVQELIHRGARVNIKDKNHGNDDHWSDPKQIVNELEDP